MITFLEKYEIPRKLLRFYPCYIPTNRNALLTIHGQYKMTLKNNIYIFYVSKCLRKKCGH